MQETSFSIKIVSNRHETCWGTNILQMLQKDFFLLKTKHSDSDREDTEPTENGKNKLNEKLFSRIVY